MMAHQQKTEIEMKTTTRKRIRSRIKIKSRTSCPRLTNAGWIMNAWT
jgi:hypothetical protein